MEDDLCNKWALAGRENQTGKILLLSFQSQPVDQSVNNEPYLKKSSRVSAANCICVSNGDMLQ